MPDALTMQDEISQREQQVSLIKEWINELRTTIQPQATGRLHRKKSIKPDSIAFKPGYCCLGIACEVGVKHNLIVKNNKMDEFDTYYSPSDNDRFTQNSTLGDMRDIFGITYNEQTKLITMNDQEGRSFGEIADFIEKNILPRLQERLDDVKALQAARNKEVNTDTI